MARRLFSISAGFIFLVLFAIVTMLVQRSLPLWQNVSLPDFLTGRVWKPDQGLFGLLPFILGTFWTTGLGIAFALPLSLFSAIYLAEYARPLTRTVIKPVLDILAGIPSVIYGMWGVLVVVPVVQTTVAPLFSRAFPGIGLFQSSNPTGFSILSAGIVLAIMIAPILIAIMYEILLAVPVGLREASMAVGASRWQTIKYIVLPKATSGLIAAMILGTSRALGETMAVLMVVGNVAALPRSLFDPAYPIPALIANNYGEMMSIPLYDSALMAAALFLLLIVLSFNILSSLALRRMLQ
ncbi:phosphate ABC transporter permease [Bellilinea caldifistulae]|uniref:Phosphate transport system permease protein n=1 Tax=Bellilinea caldifistulae TaxID=360411 RepID=A0A0P6X4G7_9CHLR|nr:phosphate ABC transporter permease [Bellilinea caldifistulae]